MSIGGGIALFVIGAILVFAVNVEISAIDIDVIGYIMMGAGFLIFVIGMLMLMRRRQSASVTRTQVDPASGESITRRSASSDEV